MPVMKGKVGKFTVNALRDTGCSGVIGQDSFVGEDQYTGQYSYILLLIILRSHLKREVEAQVLPEGICDHWQCSWCKSSQ